MHHMHNPPSSPPVLSSIEPPAPIFGPASHSIPSDNVSGSSRSSPAPDTTPPPTPGQLQPPVNLNSDILGKIPQKDRSHVQHFEREADAYGIARVPHHIRKPSSDALQNLVCLFNFHLILASFVDLVVRLKCRCHTLRHRRHLWGVTTLSRELSWRLQMLNIIRKLL